MKFLKSFLFACLLVFSSSNHAGFPDDYENKLGDTLLRGQSLINPTTPANFYVALFTTSCTDSAPGTEVSGGGYARQAVSRDLSSWTGTHGTTTGVSTGTSGQFANAAAITFPAPTANWNTVQAVGLMDALTGGNQVICNNLVSPKTVNSGDNAPKFNAGSLIITIN